MALLLHLVLALAAFLGLAGASGAVAHAITRRRDFDDWFSYAAVLVVALTCVPWLWSWGAMVGSVLTGVSVAAGSAIGFAIARSSQSLPPTARATGRRQP